VKKQKRCAICGCLLSRVPDTYGTPAVAGRSHLSKRHYVAERFFGRSKNRAGEQREPIFEQCPWNTEYQTAEFCYDCHEEILHNPVFLPEDVSKFAKLVELRRLMEPKKTANKKKLGGRIVLLHEVLELGIDRLLAKEKKELQKLPR